MTGVAALIVAAGRGRRMGADLPKQYLGLGAGTVLHRTLSVFLSVREITSVVVVINPDDQRLYADAIAALSDPRLRAAVDGGETRAMSVRNGLEALTALNPAKVLIHDAARPFVAPETIRAVIDTLDEADGAFAALPVVDALWSVSDGHAMSPVPRDSMWRAQTPQGFRFDPILTAHRGADAQATDDVAVARAAGLAVRVVEGSEDNFKITTAADLARARAIIPD